MNNASFVYSTATGPAGDIAIANETDEKFWENDTSRTGNSPTSVWEESLVGVWHMRNESGTVYDSTVNDNDGTNYGLDETSGRFGRAIECDEISTERVQISDDPTLDGMSNLTVEIWVKPKEIVNGMTFIGKYVTDPPTSPKGSYLIQVANTTGAIRFVVGDTDSRRYVAGANDVISLNSWSHIVGVWRGTDGDMKIYINGNEQTTLMEDVGTATGTVADTTLDLILGARHDAAGDCCIQYVNGTIDEVRIYNRTLTGEEIQIRYWNGINNMTRLGTEETFGVAPRWSNNETHPHSPQTYAPGANYGFQIDWDGILDPDTNVSFYIGGTEYTTSTTPAIQNQTDTYWINFTQDQLGKADTYSYYWVGDNGTSNTTDTWQYVINKASTTLHLALNDTEGDLTTTYPNVTNATAWKEVTGGTLTLLRNGTSVSNPEILQLIADTYNYTTTLTHENYTATPVTRTLTLNKGNSELSLTASPGWSVAENTEVTITCSAVSPLTITLYKDGVNVSSPYIATLPFDTYNFTCQISDVQNYTPTVTTKYLTVSTGGFGCSDNDTFAFEATVTTSYYQTLLNFTTFVEDDLVKDDLSDVILNTSNASSQTRIENNLYYFVVRSENVSSFVVRFGNFIANYTYTNFTGTVENVTSFTYSEVNPYYVLIFYEEATGEQQVPPNTNRTISLICSSGASSFSFNDSKFLVASFEQLEEIKAKVSYSATEIYYRNLLVSSDVEYKNYYLVDANVNQVVQLLISLQDWTGDFDGSTLRVKKYLEGTLHTISENIFDAEDKAVIYLINGDRYSLYIDNGVEVRSVGDLYVDTVDLTKTIVLTETFELDRTLGNISYSLVYDNNTDSIVFTYYDSQGNTSFVEFYVYNYTDGTQLYFGNTTNRSRVSYTYPVPNENQTYQVKVRAYHDVFGGSPWLTLDQLITGAVTALVMPIAIPSTTLLFIGALTIISIPMLFGAIHGALGGVITVLFAALLSYWGIYSISIALLIIFAIYSILNVLYARRRYVE